MGKKKQKKAATRELEAFTKEYNRLNRKYEKSGLSPAEYAKMMFLGVEIGTRTAADSKLVFGEVCPKTTSRKAVVVLPASYALTPAQEKKLRSICKPPTKKQMKEVIGDPSLGPTFHRVR